MVCGWIGLLVSAGSAGVYGEEPGQGKELLTLSLEQLLEVEVISVAKKSQTIAESPAAITVITRQDIRRSGATHIGELLRLVPGLDVARMNSYDWQISARGNFNGVYPNKLLVLVDGRSVYNLQVSTVFWDVVDLPLADIDRIEVIRGPGGTLWGANAVNGVINIITKSAGETQGGLVDLTGGTHLHQASLRYGGKLGSGTYRTYFKTTHTDNFERGTHPDSRHLNLAGFRFDNEAEAAATRFSLQGQAFVSDAHDTDWETLAAEFARVRGGHVLGKWQRDSGDGSEWMVQAYYDHSWRERASYGVLNQIADLEIQHGLSLGTRHELIWGGGFRYLYSSIPSTSVLLRDPLIREDRLFSAMLQDEIELRPEQLYLILGTKFEHNNYTGFEYQPNLRLRWSPRPGLSLWGALSRAVRTPAQTSTDILADIEVAPAQNPMYPIPLVIALRGNSDIDSEQATVWEMGARGSAGEGTTWDLALFYADYSDVIVRSDRFHTDSANHRLVLFGNYLNGMEVETYGAEVSLDWQCEAWRARLGYSLLEIHSSLSPGVESNFANIESETPARQLFLHAGYTPTPSWDIGFWTRAVSGLGSEAVPTVPAYIMSDLRIARRVRPGLELAFKATNLFDPYHPEYSFSSFYPHVNEIPRGIHVQLRWDL